jgi:hypothetical protein
MNDRELLELANEQVSNANNEYPLYPELRPGGAEEAQRLMDKFKEEMRALCSNTLEELYVGVAAYVESDNWTNFRNDLMDGLQDYSNRKIQGEYDFKKIRQAILREYRQDIIADLNADLVAENEELKKRIEQMSDRGRY